MAKMKVSHTGLAAVALVGLLVTAQARAQEQVYWPASAGTFTGGQQTYFPMGTPIALTTRTQVSTKDNKPGDRIYLEVAEALSYRGQVVLPTGSVAVGEVARADRNGHFGKKGKLDIHLLYVQTPSGPVRLEGRAHDEGTSGTAASIATIAFVSGLGFLIHGTSAKLPSGTTVQAYLAEPLNFRQQPNAQVQSADVVQPDGGRGLAVRFDAAPRDAVPQIAQR